MNNNIFFINNDNLSLNTSTHKIESIHVPGKGFGNLDISNNIRYGNPSRGNNNEYKEQLESKVSFEYQINYLNKPNNEGINNIFTKNTYTPLFINNNNNIFDRTGENTRKQNQLNINRDFNPEFNYTSKQNEFKFNYN